MDIIDYNDYISAFDDDEVDEGIRKALAGGRTLSVTVDDTETNYDGTENKSVTVNVTSKIAEHNAVSSAHKELFAEKVDKEAGKGLSANDYTSTEKNKLGTIESGAQVNVIESVSVNAIPLTPSEKSVNIIVPTKTSDLNNDSSFPSDAGYVHTDNNYTSAEKSKLAGIKAGAQVNTIESIQVNGTALPPDGNKAVNFVPTISDVSGLSAALGSKESSGTASEAVSAHNGSNSAHADIRSAIPTALSDLSDDETHRTVTDTDKSTWSAKQDVISDLSTIRSGAALGATAVQPQGNAGFHNSIYRGKYLGTSVTAAQYAAIAAGTFEDLYIGDYWTIDNVNWRIAAFDYWLHCGNIECTTHHVVIVPDSNLVAGCPVNSTSTTTGAYVGSDFYTGANGNTGKSQCITKINDAFGSAHILSHREYLKNTVTNGYESAGAWYDSTVELMTEQMVYGCRVFGSVVNGTNIPAPYTIDNAQLPLFALEHSRICNRESWWLRDVVSSTHFVSVAGSGRCNYDSASYSSINIRPAFAIKA